MYRCAICEAPAQIPCRCLAEMDCCQEQRFPAVCDSSLEISLEVKKPETRPASNWPFPEQSKVNVASGEDAYDFNLAFG